MSRKATRLFDQVSFDGIYLTWPSVFNWNKWMQTKQIYWRWYSMTVVTAGAFISTPGSEHTQDASISCNRGVTVFMPWGHALMFAWLFHLFLLYRQKERTVDWVSFCKKLTPWYYKRRLASYVPICPRNQLQPWEI